jgi:hypothetical protein
MKDAQTLEALKRAGADLRKPAPVTGYLYFPSKRSSDQAMVDLASAGYHVESRPAPAGNKHVVLAELEMTPTHDNIRMMRLRFEEVARRLNGQFDGWESPVLR